LAINPDHRLPGFKEVNLMKAVKVGSTDVRLVIDTVRQ